MARCNGKTKLGKRCSITSVSNLRNEAGHLVSEPLRRGGRYCAIHCPTFCTNPVSLNAGCEVLLVILDLETTGVDVVNDRIVELAATHVPMDHLAIGGSFATVLRVESDVLQRGFAAAAVHGICDAEIEKGIPFPVAWQLFNEWLQHLVNSSVCDELPDSSDDEPCSPKLADEPCVALAAHNGSRFDFPLLLCELLRHRLPVSSFETWLFVDTMHVCRCIEGCGCLKLQCLALAASADAGHAHRALDDCLALKQVLQVYAQRLGQPVRDLLCSFATECDVNSSLAHLASLMEKD